MATACGDQGLAPNTNERSPQLPSTGGMRSTQAPNICKSVRMFACSPHSMCLGSGGIANMSLVSEVWAELIVAPLKLQTWRPFPMQRCLSVDCRGCSQVRAGYGQDLFASSGQTCMCRITLMFLCCAGQPLSHISSRCYALYSELVYDALGGHISLSVFGLASLAQVL